MQGLDASAVAERVGEALGLVGLSGTQERDVTTLSGGEQQRVALARAIAARPRLLLLDEPLGSLDRVLRTDLLASLPRLFARLGTTVVTVTHDQEEALALADRIAVLDQGRVLQFGAPEEVWERPASVEVARFLGLGPVLRARVRAHAAATPLGVLAAAGVADGEVDVVLLPGALVADADGPLVGRVTGRRFAGDSTRLTVTVDAIEVELAVAVDDPVRPGDTIALLCDPSRLRWLVPGPAHALAAPGGPDASGHPDPQDQ
jgi:thiamine transport system ATP-binding protein